MKCIKLTYLLVLALMTGCATKMPEKVLSIRGLAEPVSVAVRNPEGEGNFGGIDRLARNADGKIDANVLLVHGIGWTQAAKEQKIGFDFINALEVAYRVPLGSFKDRVARLCGESSGTVADPSNYRVGGLRLRSSAHPKRYYTDDPLSPIVSSEIACMDRIDITLGDSGVVHLYRLLWDDAFYKAFEYPHLGYDDGVFTGHEVASEQYGGYENIDALRLARNRDYKNSLITYGLSDAAMYIGPAGKLLRDAVRGGLCAVVNDATGQTRTFADIWSSSEKEAIRDVEVQSLCEINGTAKDSGRLVVMAESLGSRIVFDVLTRMRQESRPDGIGSWDSLLTGKLSQISGTELEVYLMANQIPLIATGAVSPDFVPSTPNPGGKSLKFVAFSEINDLLTYELVPYFEHLAYLRCWGQAVLPAAYPNCASENPTTTARNLVTKIKPGLLARSQLVRELGFDVVDVRLSFAPLISSFVPDLADPLEAHTGHLRHRVVPELLLCGARDGKINRIGCGIP